MSHTSLVKLALADYRRKNKNLAITYDRMSKKQNTKTNDNNSEQTCVLPEMRWDEKNKTDETKIYLSISD
jgi:hypothetical protein